MDLPPHVNDMIERVASVCSKTVIVNFSGTPVTMPWADQVPAIIQAWYGGNEAGNGIADVLFGDFNPGGKLPVSWPRQIEDDPTYLNFGSSMGRCLYGEDIYLGYRFYDKIARSPQWSFGHGLSYSTFELSSLTVSSCESGRPEICKAFPATKATLKINNTSRVAGSEVLQLYIQPPSTSLINRPRKELQGFERVYIEPGEERTVDIKIDPYAMSYWDEFEGSWCLESGTYTVVVATSSSSKINDGTLRLEAALEIVETRRWLGL
jgi:beta-glucosidase